MPDERYRPQRAAPIFTALRRRPIPTTGPFVMSAADMPPDGAVPPVPGRCDGCPAAAVVVFWRVVLLIPDGWALALPWVRELHLCAHHARAAEPVLREWGGEGITGADVGAWAPALDCRATSAPWGR